MEKDERYALAGFAFEGNRRRAPIESVEPAIRSACKRVKAIRYCIIQAASLKCDDSDALDGAVSMMFDTIQAHDGGREEQPVRHRCGVEHRPPQPAHA